MSPIVHQPSPPAIGQIPAAHSDFSDTARWATVAVTDREHAPKYVPGDVLVIDLKVTDFRYDAMYAVEINGKQHLRYVQSRGSDGMYVYVLSGIYKGTLIPRAALRVLGLVTYANTLRRVG
ncbi:hypothetical protein [Stenotrophomonas maltophilia]|uniref:hypothetical protein n=1 Tax=Stenotrophomonas maltophilia TaxID=40324 RepID=UPI002115315A|nr:hypothetical protein [Stenotrophomonas maltophilia]